MKHRLSLTEQKHILNLYITRASGRPRELIDVLLGAYPKPMSCRELKLALHMTGGHALPSAVRNAEIFIDVIKRYYSTTKKTYYQLDDACVERVALNQLLNRVMGSS